MPLIVEDGSGIPGANSYVTLAEAEDYFALKGVTVDLIEADLVNATQYLDLMFGMAYNGRLADDDQSLLWPRTVFFDNLGRRRDANTIPNELKVATYEAAKLSSNESLFTATNPESNVQAFSNSVDGAVSESKTFFSPTVTEEDFMRGRLRAYLSPILTTGGLSSLNGRRVK